MTVDVTLSYDLRAPAFGAPQSTLAAAALDQCRWADDVGIDAINVMEHHASSDSYLPSPIVFAAAVAARTSSIPIWISALVLPLHDPVLVAEELAVLDLVSAGRIVLVLVAGYRRVEFEMFGVDFDRRVALLAEGIAVLDTAWTGEPFECLGRRAQVLPRPVQRPRIPIVIGGSSPSSARRAARIADGYRPSRRELIDVYRAELEALGRPAPLIEPTIAGHPTVFVSADPERDWELIAPHAVHDTRQYAEWTREQAAGTRHSPAADADSVRSTGQYLVLTPDQAVQRVLDGEGLHLKPLLGGLDPALSWAGLRLLEDEVLSNLPLRITPSGADEGRDQL